MSSRAIQMEEFNLTLMNKYTWFDGLTYNTHMYFGIISYISYELCLQVVHLQTFR